MEGQDARPAAMLEEIVVAGAMPQQRKTQQEHAHRMSCADGESRRTQPSVHRNRLVGFATSSIQRNGQKFTI